MACLACRTEEPRFESRRTPSRGAEAHESSPAEPGAAPTEEPNDPTASCRAGNHDACLSLAGGPTACVELALHREPNDPALALQLYLTACEHDVLAGCANASDPLRATDPERARRLAARACEGNDAMGCNNLGVIEQDTQRLDEALVAYRRACTLGLAIACGQIGALGSVGLVPMDPAEITAMLTSACDRGDARSCGNLGRNAIRVDPVVARDAFRRACELDYASGCYDYALALVRGEGGAADRDAAERSGTTTPVPPSFPADPPLPLNSSRASRARSPRRSRRRRSRARPTCIGTRAPRVARGSSRAPSPRA